MEKDAQAKIIILIAFLLIISIALIKVFYQSCYIEEYKLLNQTLKISSKCTNSQCLFIDVENNKGIISNIWFKDDILLLNQSQKIQVGDNINIKWCKIKNIGYRVRGLEKISKV
jgi:hypothetical protein